MAMAGTEGLVSVRYMLPDAQIHAGLYYFVLSQRCSITPYQMMCPCTCSYTPSFMCLCVYPTIYASVAQPCFRSITTQSPLTCSLTHSRTHSLTHPLTHSLTRCCCPCTGCSMRAMAPVWQRYTWLQPHCQRAISSLPHCSAPSTFP